MPFSTKVPCSTLLTPPLVVQPATGNQKEQLAKLQLMQVDDGVQAAPEVGDCCDGVNSVNQAVEKTIELLTESLFVS
jgi:hypothetical protein